MVSNEDNQGPSLGGSTSTNLSGPTPPSLSGPQPPNTSEPSLGGSSTPIDKKPSEKVDISNKKQSKSKKVKINPHEMVRRWGVITRKIPRSLQVMMSKEFKTMVRVTSLNKLFRDLIIMFFEGQIEYFKEMIEIINQGNDILSQDLMEKDLESRASTQVFESLQEIVKDEIEEFSEEKPKFIDVLEKHLKVHRDARLEPRACYWILFATGLQLNDIHSKAEHEFDIVMDVLLRYKPVQKRVLAVFLHFCYYLIREIPPYHIDSCRVNLTPGPTGTGYNLAPWIKYRYGTNSQRYISFDRYLNYFARSFGKISGTAPQAHKDGFQSWLNRTLISLEKAMKRSPFLTEKAKGNTLEGMLVGLKEEFEEQLEKREFDSDGKLVNQPIGGEGAMKFLDWLFETAFRRFKTTNISSHGKIRLSLDMFDFIDVTINWVNEYGEQIAHDWLELEQEEEHKLEK